ncbi:MAG: complex I NDUFA9 subunit family protein [Gammaproteobacteria bacterium]|nr:complex I NDUFA9 subunit family protein [Gammaproteobacteria bacterium]MCP5201699.1 complex I NDUFA9 subunit family protein [Gammaproteobacteria bacterium]
MSRMTIGILGGSGFVGGVLANRLVAGGHRVRIFTRARSHAREVWLLPDTEVIELDPREQEQYNHGFAGLDAVVNLVGILNERGDDGTGFRQAHVDIPLRAAKACKTADVPHLLHMSALNADSFAPSYYLRSKGEAEKLLLAESGKRLTVTILRPSVMFGPHDDFTNRFAALLRLAPGVFPLARADARLQPVFVGDVAEAMLRCLTRREAAGQRYDLGGPEVMTLGEIVSYLGRVIGRPVRVIGLNGFLSSLQANILEHVPGKPFSRDNLRSLSEDSVCPQANGLDQLGIEPTPMRVVVPRYLGGGDLRHRYYAHRTSAGRD